METCPEKGDCARTYKRLAMESTVCNQPVFSFTAGESMHYLSRGRPDARSRRSMSGSCILAHPLNSTSMGVELTVETSKLPKHFRGGKGPAKP